ncbi:type II toxin-antitoxin system HicA family toxin [Fredinandcohnia sp. 179-A 10B2 NHS]|uniref:type II toxin-antitoxin system HicA family toxin n=1 Tax=Fredinandcohnia sp. 179-A 10B2 NHS TaxID=3235176 RepID=UPI0039A359BE
MASVEKIIEKMKTQPRGIRYPDAAKVLNHFGYILVRKKGSHRHFRNDAGDIVVLKEESPLKISYTEDILRRINEI